MGRLFTGTFLCEHQSSEFLKHIRPEWNDVIAESMQTKLSFMQTIGFRMGSNSFRWFDATGIEKRKRVDC